MWSHFGRLRLGDSRGRDCHIYDVLTNVDWEPFSQGGLLLLWRDFFVVDDDDEDEDR